MQSPSEKPRKISHARNRSISFQPHLPFPSDRQFPIYAQYNARPNKKPTRLHCNTNIILPPTGHDLMRTIDNRFPEKCRRSSFALSDIFETDEDEVEIEVSPILPSTPNSASSFSTTQSVRSRMKIVLLDLACAVKAGWLRSSKMYVVEPADRSIEVDLL